MTNESTAGRELCAVCGKGHVETRHMENVYKDGDLAVKYLDEFFWCPACGDEFYTTEQDMARSRAISIAVAKARHAMTPDRIRVARLKLGWTQEEIQEAFGVGPKTWTRYERGTVVPSKAANFMLWMVEQHPEIVEEYRDRNKLHDLGKDLIKGLKAVGIITASNPGRPGLTNVRKPSDADVGLSPDQVYSRPTLVRHA